MVIADVFRRCLSAGPARSFTKWSMVGLCQLAFRVDSAANSIAWLVWHLTRIQDDHVADVAQTEQVWTAGGWSDRSSCRLRRRRLATDTPAMRRAAPKRSGSC